VERTACRIGSASFKGFPTAFKEADIAAGKGFGTILEDRRGRGHALKLLPVDRNKTLGKGLRHRLQARESAQARSHDPTAQPTR
jgi:hypothetical protein